MLSKMNTRIPLIALCLLMAFGLSNCKDDAVEEPIEYNFDDEFKDITVEPVTETEPASVEATEADVTDSATEDAAAAALESGTATDEMNAASDAIADVVSEEEATALSDALASGAELSTEQQSSIDAILATGSLDAFFPTTVLPTVDGETISARKATSPREVTLLNLTEMLLGVSDECTDAAEASLAAAKATLDAAKASQDATINATYTTREAAINAAYATGTAAITAKWAAKKTAAEDKAASMIAAIEANNLPAFLKLLVNIVLNQKLASYITLEAADLNAATQVQTKALANAAAARDADLATSEANYNTALNEATAIAAAAANSCHNQGGSN